VFRCINLANATPDELEQLTQACQVFEAYSKAGKMDSELFSSSLDPSHTDLIKIIRGYLLEGEESTRSMEMKAYKLNIYSAHLILILACSYPILYCRPGKGSSFKPHVDTPQSKNMFGSLVIVFPTLHKGGVLSLRHRGREWIFDPGQALAGGALGQPSIGYVAFLNDVEQDVAPITSGHCVTLTYNLYFEDDGGPVSEKGAVAEHFIPPKPPNQGGFREAFEALLENPEFMAEGGTLAFGLRRDYPIEHKSFEHVCNVLKGSDAVVYHSVRALGFEPMLYMYHDGTCGPHEGVIIDKLVYFNDACLDEDDAAAIHNAIEEEGGIPVRQDGGKIDYYDSSSYIHYDRGYIKNLEPVEWVTPATTYNREERVYATSESQDTMKPRIYGGACIFVRIGKVGDRLAYPTVAQINKVYGGSRHDSREDDSGSDESDVSDVSDESDESDYSRSFYEPWL
jgi:hypothetical protein